MESFNIEDNQKEVENKYTKEDVLNKIQIIRDFLQNPEYYRPSRYSSYIRRDLWEFNGLELVIRDDDLTFYKRENGDLLYQVTIKAESGDVILKGTDMKSFMEDKISFKPKEHVIPRMR